MRISALLSRLLLPAALAFGLGTTTVTAQTAPAAPATDLVEGAKAQADSLTDVQTGVYILRLNNVSQKDGTFDVDMWVWFRWKGADVRPYDTFEISNGTINNRSTAEVLNDGGYNYTSIRVQATVFHDYDVRHFPMDNHILTLEFEDQNLDAAHLRFVADPQSALDPGLAVAGWDVKLEAPNVVDHHYPTNYGLQSAGTEGATYSRMIVPVELTRTSVAPLFKEFWISVLSVLLGLLAFRVRATDLDARFGLGVGSIFAASANAFVISDNLPKTTVVTLAEQINFLAIGTIFLSVFMSIASLRLCYAGREDASERLDTRALAVIMPLYLAANALVVYLQLG